MLIYFSYPDNCEPWSSLFFCRKLLCPKYVAASGSAHQLEELSGSAPVFLSYFSLTGRKIQQWCEINHNVLYRSLGDVTRKRAVMTRGLALWKNGSWCHKANSL